MKNERRRIKVSIVVCFNDQEILEENLLKSLRQQQNIDFELMAVDNTRRKFLSIPSALNDGGRRATGDYIMFIHQDVYLCGIDWLDKALNFLYKLPNVGAAGVAGVDSNGKPVGFILDRGRYWGRPLGEPFPVQTLDEQLIIIPRGVFEKVKFDERFNFHLYGADYCLSVQNLGLKVYVLPLMVEHNSLTIGTLNASSIESQDAMLRKKYLGLHKVIYKTTGNLGRKRDALRKRIASLYSNFFFASSLIILRLWKISMNQKIVLDVGCIPLEQHALKKYLAKKKFSVGISNNNRYLVISKKLGVHDDYVVAAPERLPFRERSFDIAFLSGLLEYLSKDKGEQVVYASEEVAKGSIVKVPCSCSPIDTTHMVFRSCWEVNDFKGRHYRTFSIGLKQRAFPCILFAYKSAYI